jgi:hypothetical protein
MVSRDGVIRTIAGSGRPAKTIANGAPALSAALGTQLSIALSPTGQLYISTGTPSGSQQSQILRLTAVGTLDRVRDRKVREGRQPRGPNGTLQAAQRLWRHRDRWPRGY